MHLTSHTDYSLRLLIYLQVSVPEPVSVRQVSEAYGISTNHLAKVAQRLTQLGWIASRRGRGGGLTLEPEAQKLKLGHVIRTLEPSTSLVECHTADSHCPIEAACELKSILREAQQAFFASLDRYTLGDLAERRAQLIPLLGRIEKPSAPALAPPITPSSTESSKAQLGSEQAGG